MTSESPTLNEHNKQEFPPAHNGEFDSSQTVSYEQGYAIRGLATIMIIFVHSINEYEWYNSRLSNLLLICMFGTFGCSLFFFMSGYGIMNSLRKRGKETKNSYLLAHIKKIVIPLAIVYAINSIVLPHTLTYNNITIDHSNILTFSLPEGTDIWFVKIIIFDYLTTFFIFKYISDCKKQLTYIAITQTALIVLLYILKAGSYWYVSNLCFVLGALHSTFPIFKKKYIITSIFIFIAAYFCLVNGIISAPIQIFNNITFCTIIIYAMSKMTKWPKWFCFIGKNSLLYYLLNIPIMWLIPSNNMYAVTYFFANVIFTTISIFIYNKVAKSIKINTAK